jgi:hypothetical protein
MRRYWPSEERWTGFVLLLVPTSGLSVDIEVLYQRVKRWLRTDVDLADVATVAHSLPVSAGDKRDASMIVRAFEQAAMQPGHLVAPRVVFGCVVVDDSEEEARRLVALLADTPRFDDLPVHFFGVGAAPQPPERPSGDRDDAVQGRRTEPSQALVDAVIGHMHDMVDALQRMPTFAIGEAAYVGFVDQANDRSSARTAILTPRPPSPHPQPRQQPERRNTPEHSGSASQVVLHKADGYTADGYTADERPTERMEERPPEVHTPEPAKEDADGVRPPIDVVGMFRKVVGKIGPRERKLTDLEVLDRVASAGDSIELSCLVLVADRSGTAPGRQRDVVLAVDQQIGTVRERTGRPVMTAVFTAGRRLQRIGPLRAAGELTKRDIPRLPAEHFDLVDCVNDLLDALDRERSALRRRGTIVSSVRICLLSTMVPLADMGAIERIEALSGVASVSWILIDTDPTLMSGEFAEAGVLVLEDHADVAGELVDRMFIPTPGQS